MSDNKLSECRGCGNPILWVSVVKADGEKGLVPLDPRAPVYMVTGRTEPDGNPFAVKLGALGKTIDSSTPKAYVSHFATCPQANRFSGGRKEESRG